MSETEPMMVDRAKLREKLAYFERVDAPLSQAEMSEFRALQHLESLLVNPAGGSGDE